MRCRTLFTSRGCFTSSPSPSSPPGDCQYQPIEQFQPNRVIHPIHPTEPSTPTDPTTPSTPFLLPFRMGSHIISVGLLGCVHYKRMLAQMSEMFCLMQTYYFVAILSLLKIQLPLLYNRPLSASVGRAVLSHKNGAKKSHTYWNDRERAGQVFSDHHDCTRIVELTAVVWGREECDQ